MHGHPTSIEGDDHDQNAHSPVPPRSQPVQGQCGKPPPQPRTCLVSKLLTCSLPTFRNGHVPGWRARGRAAYVVLIGSCSSFLIQWYSTPPLLKAWQDAVLTRMYYIAYESEGRQPKEGC